MAIKRTCNGKNLHRKAILLAVLFFMPLIFNTIRTAIANGIDSTDVVLTAEEVLIVELFPNTNESSGNTGDFLRNIYNLSVKTNNGAGHVAYMNTKTSATALANTVSSATIPTLTSNTSWTRASSETNFWGYSTDDICLMGGCAGTYYPMVGSNDTPILLSSVNSGGSVSVTNMTVWFGAKIDSTKDSGTYTNTVVFTIISGMSTIPSGGNPDPNPAGPQDGGDEVVAYDSSGDQTVYTNRNDSRTEISTGDNRSSYPGATEVTFTPPQGVTTYINDGTPLATGLAVTAAVAATTGIIFLVATKDDDEDEEEA